MLACLAACGGSHHSTCTKQLAQCLSWPYGHPPSYTNPDPLLSPQFGVCGPYETATWFEGPGVLSIEYYSLQTDCLIASVLDEPVPPYEVCEEGPEDFQEPSCQ